MATVTMPPQEPANQMLSENPESWPYPCAHETVPAIFTSAECNEITRIGREAALSRATVIKNDGGVIYQPLVRHAKIARISPDQSTDWIFERIYAALVRANAARWHYELGSIDRIDFAQYSLGGHYLWHTDVGPGRNITRKLSFSVQLSAPSAYLGGRLQFLRGYRQPTASRALGSITIFPSFMTHRVKPVLYGRRDALVGWIKGDTPLR